MTDEINPLYFDYAATTPIDPEVIAAMLEIMQSDKYMGNPSSSYHLPGVRARELVENARVDVAELLGAYPEEIIFTSGATESNNFIIKNVSASLSPHKRHIITSEIEHKSVLMSCRYLETLGFQVEYLRPNAEGYIEPEAIEQSLRDDTALVSIMYVNNELGSINDIQTIGNLLKRKQILFHVDAVQACGKIPLDAKKLNIDFLTFTAHKIYGPMGVGGVYIREGTMDMLIPQLHGGSQENNLRAGTIPTHQVVGIGKCFSLAKQNMRHTHSHMTSLKEQLMTGLHDRMDIISNTPDRCVPNILNLQILGVPSKSLLMHTPEIAVAVGSACSANDNAYSYVLKALGLKQQAIESSIRISFGRFTTHDHIDQFISLLANSVARIKRRIPS